MYLLVYTRLGLCTQTEDILDHLDMMHILHPMDSTLKDMYTCYSHLESIASLEYN